MLHKFKENRNLKGVGITDSFSESLELGQAERMASVVSDIPGDRQQAGQTTEENCCRVCGGERVKQEERACPDRQGSRVLGWAGLLFSVTQHLSGIGISRN